MTKRVRPSKEQYYMLIAQVVATRSNCVRRQIGAIVVVDDRIVATGYNGTPRGHKNCDEGGCPRCNSQGEQQSGQNLGECLCIHAEENCIASAAFHGGTKMRGGVIYTLMSPCLICSKLILNAGITAVMYRDVYPVNGLRLLIEAGVDVHQLDMERKHMRQIRTNEGKVRIDEKHHIESDRIVKTSNGQAMTDDEPRILFRGRDKLALPMLEFYKMLCEKDGCTSYQLESIDKMIAEFREFSETSATMKQPGVTLGK